MLDEKEVTGAKSLTSLIYNGRVCLELVKLLKL
jgi:hypothetical protein